jgi:hypothetical protein
MSDKKVKPLAPELSPNGQWSLAKSWDKKFDRPNSSGEHFHVLTPTSSGNKFKQVAETKDGHYHFTDGSKKSMEGHQETRWIHPDQLEANQPKSDALKNFFSKNESAMAHSNIVELQHHIKELKSQLKPGEALPEWVEAKLTLATDYLSIIAHFVDGAHEAGKSLTKSDIEKLDLLKGQLLQLKDFKKPSVSDPIKAKKLISDAKALGDKQFKSKMKSLASEKSESSVEKADGGSSGWSHNPETGNFNHKLHGSIMLKPNTEGGFHLLHNGSPMRTFNSKDSALAGMQGYMSDLGRSKVANADSIKANKRTNLGQF